MKTLLIEYRHIFIYLQNSKYHSISIKGPFPEVEGRKMGTHESLEISYIVIVYNSIWAVHQDFQTSTP